MKTYFVTGGEGFIGHHICKELLKDENNKVITYDALKHFVLLDESNWTYYQNYRTKRLNSNNLTRIRGAMSSRGFLQEILEKYKPNVLIHLAALPIANISNTHCEEAHEDVFGAIVNLLDVTKSLSYGIDRLIYTSSSMVYGDFKRDEEGKILPANEEQECRPKGIYGGMKLSGEILVKTYSDRFDIPSVIIRPSAVYGPTDCNRRVTEIFVMNSFFNKDLVLENGGQHQLDFTYVEDLVKGYVLASKLESAVGETFNLTRGEGRTIEELAKIITSINPGSKIISKKTKVYRPNRGALDISKARELLGYNPLYSLEKGMEKYIKFVKKNFIDNHLF